MQSIEGSLFSRVRSVANAVTHPHTLITDRFRRKAGGPSPRGPSAPPEVAQSTPDPTAPDDQPAEEQPMMDVSPEAVAGFQFGPAMLSKMRSLARPGLHLPGMQQAAHMMRRRQHHAPPPRGWRGPQLRGRPGVHGVDCDVAGAGFWQGLMSKFKAARANHAAKQHVQKEAMCRKLLAPVQAGHLRRQAATMGLSWDGLKKAAGGANRASKDRYGRLLISAMPYGATALQARDLANAALRSGDLQPAHLAAAGDLARRGRAGDDDALFKIAVIKNKAGRGDAAAEKAYDTIKVAQVVQTGGRARAGRGGGGGGPGGGRYHRAGLANLMRG